MTDVLTHPFVLARVLHYSQTRPESTALAFGDVDISYAELAERVNRLASELIDLHHEPGSPVVVQLPRGPEQVVAMLALWQAGLAFLPVDHRDPSRRLDDIRSTTGASATISADVDNAWGSSIKVSAAAAHPRRQTQSVHGFDPASVAYVIFTSGSSGRPKGVVASHESLTSLIEQLTHRYGIMSDDRVLQFGAPTFDTSIEQVCVALAAGATLVLPETVWAPSEFHQKIEQAGITVMDLTPSYWRDIITASGGAERSRARPRLLILGGAAVTNRDLDDARSIYPQARILNAYGLTETGITSCLAEFDGAAGARNGPAAVGHPLDGSAVAVLDGSDAPLAPGVAGSVVVAGRLAVGITSGSGTVVPLPTVSIGGENFYRTGDTGYVDQFRGLVITGRTDRQLKIRGFRVDPDEVENALRQLPHIQDCAVVASGSGSALHAFYTLAPGTSDPGRSDLLSALRTTLPSYSIPSDATPLDSLPQTRHGKTDYRALTEHALSGTETATDIGIVLDSAIEHAIATVWTEVLKIDRHELGVPFFDAGGTSVTAAELVARTRASLGIHVRYVRALIEQLLKEPHFANFCQAVAAARSGTLVARADPREAMESDLARTITPSRAMEGDSRAHLTEASTVLLTGATGFLGSHLLPRLLTNSTARVACLVRAESDVTARDRLRAAWRKYGSAPDIPNDAFDRIDIVVGDLTQPHLGLSEVAFDQLAARTSLVVHSGGTVNFIYPYTEMKTANVDGTLELLRLASVNGAPFHHVSTMAVIAGHGVAGTSLVNEDDPLEHLDQLGVGYVESKWVSEHLVHDAGRAGLPVAVYRAADISGHSTRGTWNTATEMCCMKRFIADIGAIPLAELPMDYTPVDVFADALVHIATHEPTDGRVYHLTNPNKTHISLLRERLQARGRDIGELPWDEWISRMIDLAVSNPRHPMTPFAPLFIDKCPGGQMSVAAMYLEDTFPGFTRTNVDRALAGTNITFPDVDAALIDRYLDFLEREEFLWA